MIDYPKDLRFSRSLRPACGAWSEIGSSLVNGIKGFVKRMYSGFVCRLMDFLHYINSGSAAAGSQVD